MFALHPTTSDRRLTPSMNLEIDIKPFDALTRRQLHDILALRSRVFVVEQEITEVPEVDGRDIDAHHLIARSDGEVVGTLRLLEDRQPVKLGRVAVDGDHRSRGIGTARMEAAGEYLGARPAKLHAQAHLQKWYEELGWTRRGDIFDIVGIDHVKMFWPATGDRRPTTDD